MNVVTGARIRGGALVLLVGCGIGMAFAEQADPEIQQLDAALREYAHLQVAKDAAGLAAFYTPDGELLEPGMESLKGPAAIRKFLESFGDVRMESASMTADRTQVWDDNAVQWGSYSQRVALPGKPVAEFRGRFVAQWSRQANDRWLIRCLLTQPF
jgi:uncharacterized protein (TIGR02246 family)